MEASKDVEGEVFMAGFCWYIANDGDERGDGCVHGDVGLGRLGLFAVVEWPGTFFWVLWMFEGLHAFHECVMGLYDFLLYVWWHGSSIWVIGWQVFLLEYASGVEFHAACANCVFDKVNEV